MKNVRDFSLIAILLATPAPASETRVCPQTGSDVTEVDKVHIDQEKLVITVRWAATNAPSQATIQVLDREGRLTVSQTVAPRAGAVLAYALTEDLAFFDDHGYWYTVRVAGAADAPLAETVPVLVTLCPQGAGCTYSVVEGVGTDALAIGVDLLDLLDLLAARGSSDLLNDALAARPDLEHEVYWLADQFGRLFDPNSPDGCTCLWTASVYQFPAGEQLSVSSGTSAGFETPDWATLESVGSGANFLLAAQVLGGKKRSLSAYGQGELGLHLRCWSPQSWTVATFSTRSIAFPVLVPCSAPCGDAGIELTAGAEVRSAANAWATSEDGARSTISASLSFFLGQGTNPLFSRSAEAEADRAPGDPEQAVVEDASEPVTSAWWIDGGDAVGALAAQGEVETCLQEGDAATNCHQGYSRPADDRGAWVYGCASVASRATFSGIATCAVWPHQYVTLQQIGLAHTEEGLVVSPWLP